MFGILVAAARSAQQRSPSTLRHIRSLQCTATTRQRAVKGKPDVPTPSTVPIEPATEEAPASEQAPASDEPPAKRKRGRPRTRPLPQPRDPTLPKPAKVAWQHNASPEKVAAWKERLLAGRTQNASIRAPKATAPKRATPVRLKTEKYFKAPEDQASNDIGADGATTYHIRRKINPTFTTQDIRADYFRYLMWARGMGQGKPSGDNKRINIVNPVLCDDVLERLEPSLQKHIGCDIIDVNPGVGIWSEKLHNFLKPRTHLLLEPDKATYGPVLQPLLDAPGSTYRLIEKSGIVWGHLEKVLSKEYLPHQEAFEPGDPRREQPNDTLLFVANLGYHPKRGFKGFSAVGTLVIYQLLGALRSHSLMHRYGHVRMLIWIENEETGKILPQTISSRRSFSIEAELSCEKVQAIAANSDPRYHGFQFVRPRKLVLDSVRSVYQKMQETGVSVPAGRQSKPLIEVLEGKQGDIREDYLDPEFVEELERLEARFAAGEFDEALAANNAAFGHYRALRNIARAEGRNLPTWKEMGSPRLPESQRLSFLRGRYKDVMRKFEGRGELLNDLLEIFSLQRKTAEAGESDRHVLDAELKRLTDAWEARFGELKEEEHGAVGAIADNYRAMQTTPPTLLWDRRDFEPLEVQPKEFVPAWPMALLDFQPTQMWPILQKDFPDNYDVLEYIISHLMIIPTQSLRRGLSALVPGAYEHLIAECPSLTDPTKGGSFNPEHTAVRRLTAEMFKEIIEAWASWPFKPTRYEIIRRLGSGPFSEDGLDIEGKDP